MNCSKKVIRTVSNPKRRKIYRGVWEIRPKRHKNDDFGQKRHNFGHIWISPAYRIWFSQRTPQDLFSYKKLWKFIAAIGRYKPKRQKRQFWQKKNGQFFSQNGQILAISEYSRHIKYDFLKEHHKTYFHIKKYENL